MYLGVSRDIERGRTDTNVAYDENDGGFQFSRSRAKKPEPKAAEPVVESVPLPAKEPTPPKHRRKKYSFSDSAKEDEAPKTRRSKRLSGEKAAAVQIPVLHSKSARKIQDFEPDGKQKQTQTAPPVAPPTAARSPKKIALPFADTPIIRRNKEMRKKASGEQGHRRSSTGMRGRRASSLIESGQSNAEPHNDVEIQDFYKHIEQSLPEPRRMQQLLMWCGTRVMPEKQPGDGSDGGAILAGMGYLPTETRRRADRVLARHIEEEILKDLSSKPEMSDWFSREELPPAVLVKKPNPRNAQMASKLQELELEIKRSEFDISS